MSYYSKLKNFTPLIDFLGEVCGKNFEFILHDVSDPDNSIIAIQNGHHSGRQVGGPMTDLARSVISAGEHKKKDYIANYEGRTKDGRRFVSSTYFIKERNELIGMICVNHNVQDILEINHSIANIIDAFSINQAFSMDTEKKQPEYKELLDNSIESISNNIIHSTIIKSNLSPLRMTSDEKLDIIKNLEVQGIFVTKGSVGQVAQELDISESTVYRYLKEIRKQ